MPEGSGPVMVALLGGGEFSGAGLALHQEKPPSVGQDDEVGLPFNASGRMSHRSMTRDPFASAAFGQNRLMELFFTSCGCFTLTTA